MLSYVGLDGGPVKRSHEQARAGAVHCSRVLCSVSLIFRVVYRRV
jgi:hypothetical protein